jgi:YD repeat-containing protein
MARREVKLEAVVQKVSLLICIAAILSFPRIGHPGTADYIYDGLGRLRSVGNSSGNYTEYDYDEVGNLISITTGTTSPNPPVIQAINPDVLFIGSTTSVAITGQNLLTTKKIVTGNPFVSIEISEVTDTRIMADITVSSQAPPGPANLTVTTRYGSANIQTSLTASQLSLGPGLLSLAAGTSGNVIVTVYPPLGKAETIQIANSGSFVVSAPQSVTIPATGTGVFSVNALREGVAYLSSGPSMTTVYVTSSIFAPVSGEQLTPATGPVSVYIDSPSSTPTTSSVPVSAYIDSPAGNSLTQSLPFSIGIDVPGGISVTQSIPFSVYIDSPAGSSAISSKPVSTYIDSPVENVTRQSVPVSTKISP